MSLSADPCCVAGSVFGFARFTRVFAALQCMPTHAQPHQKTHCSPSSATPGIFGLFSWFFGGSSLPPCPPRRSLFCFCGSLVVVFDSNASPIPPKDAPPATPSAPALLGLFSWYFGDNCCLKTSSAQVLNSQSAVLQAGTPALPTYRPVFSAHYWTLSFTVTISSFI